MRLIFCGLFLFSAWLPAGCTSTVPQPTLQERLAQMPRSDADQGRDTTAQPIKVLNFMEARDGMRIADLFAGGGYYSELLAIAVGSSGQVVAYNNAAYDSFAGEQAQARFKDNRLPNVRYLVGEVTSPALPGNLDGALMVMSFHDLYWEDESQGWPAIDARAFMKLVLASLRPGGALTIIDHHAAAGAGAEAVDALHRIERDFAVAELQAVGFKLVAESPVLSNPQDDRTKSVFDPDIRRKTDRFLLRFVKP